MSTARVVIDMKARAGRVEFVVVDPDGEAHSYGSISSPAEAVNLLPQIASSLALMLGMMAVEMCTESA